MVANKQYVYTIMYNIWLKLHIIWVIQFHGVSYCPIKSHYDMYVYTYVEVTQGAISMEQNMRFGLILGLLAILKKKIGPIVSKFWGHFFVFFLAEKNII